MEKESLKLFDINRLSELIIVYIAPSKDFEIEDDGTIILNKNGPLKTWFLRNSERLDFFTVTRIIIDKMMENKKLTNFAKHLLGTAVGELVTTNDRNEVIKLIYQAHLADKEPEGYENEPPEEDKDFILEKVNEREPVTRRISKVFVGGMQPSRLESMNLLAEFINSSGGIIIEEE